MLIFRVHLSNTYFTNIADIYDRFGPYHSARFGASTQRGGGSGGEARRMSDRRPEEMGKVRERYCGAYFAFVLLNQLNNSSPAQLIWWLQIIAAVKMKRTGSQDWLAVLKQLLLLRSVSFGNRSRTVFSPGTLLILSFLQRLAEQREHRVSITIVVIHPLARAHL